MTASKFQRRIRRLDALLDASAHEEPAANALGLQGMTSLENRGDAANALVTSLADEGEGAHAGAAVHFVRISHRAYMHAYTTYPISDELADVRELDRYLRSRSPRPRYHIWVILACHDCHATVSWLPLDTVTVLNLVPDSSRSQLATEDDRKTIYAALDTLTPNWL
jgi:hypothetical protein